MTQRTDRIVLRIHRRIVTLLLALIENRVDLHEKALHHIALQELATANEGRNTTTGPIRIELIRNGTVIGRHQIGLGLSQLTLHQLNIPAWLRPSLQVIQEGDQLKFVARVQVEVFGFQETAILFAGTGPVDYVQLRYVEVDVDELEVATEDGLARLEVVEELATSGWTRYCAQQGLDAGQEARCTGVEFACWDNESALLMLWHGQGLKIRG